jgi:hypothetical protein
MTTSASQGYRRILAIVVFGMALAACGDGEKLPTAQEDKARAERIVLTEADVPGLTKEPADDSSDTSTDPSDVAFEACLHNNPLLTTLGESERGADATFSDDDESVTRSSAVTFAESEKDAKAAFAELTSDSFAGCLEGTFKSGLQAEIGSDADVSGLKVAAVPVADVGDEAVAYRADVDLEAAGQSFPLSFDFVFIRADRGIVGLFAFDAAKPLDDAERARLAKILGDRLQDA